MISIVMPVYNEADVIADSAREWYDEVVSKIPGAELIVIDDASSDATPMVLEDLRKELPRLVIARAQRNRGHGPTVRRGLEMAQQPYIFQTDSDRQYSPSDFWRLWNRRDEFDLVVGVRTDRRDGAFRSFVSFGLRLLNRFVWGVWIADANCPFKLMRRESISSLLTAIPQDSFIPMIHLSVLARIRGLKVLEVSVTHLPRRQGQSSLKGLGKWVKVVTLCAWEVLKLRSRSSF